MGPAQELFHKSLSYLSKIASDPEKNSTGSVRGMSLPSLKNSHRVLSPSILLYSALTTRRGEKEEGRPRTEGGDGREFRWKDRHACAGDPSWTRMSFWLGGFRALLP